MRKRLCFRELLKDVRKKPKNGSLKASSLSTKGSKQISEGRNRSVYRRPFSGRFILSATFQATTLDGRIRRFFCR